MSHFVIKAYTITKGTEPTGYCLWPAARYPETEVQSVVNSSNKCLNVRNCTILHSTATLK